MNELILNSGKVIEWDDFIISSEGIEAHILTSTSEAEKKEIKRKIKSERDVIYFKFNN